MKAFTLEQVIGQKITELEATMVEWEAKNWSTKVLDELAEELRFILAVSSGCTGDRDAFMADKLRGLIPVAKIKAHKEWLKVVAGIWNPRS